MPSVPVMPGRQTDLISSKCLSLTEKAPGWPGCQSVTWDSEALLTLSSQAPPILLITSILSEKRMPAVPL